MALPGVKGLNSIVSHHSKRKEMWLQNEMYRIAPFTSCQKHAGVIFISPIKRSDFRSDLWSVLYWVALVCCLLRDDSCLVQYKRGLNSVAL